MFSLKIHNLSLGVSIIHGVHKVSFSSELGQHEILAGHATFFTLLEPPFMVYYTSDKRTEVQILNYGNLIFESNTCSVYIGH
ncbi:MAG: hypothetical protein LBD36_00725 [Holosporales bacterium]|jgi:F0F1-type ATP synthase epsilon subunit|nr:hypothetical protein [Holosporales bacterium]